MLKFKTLPFLFMAGLCACGTQVADDPVTREQELANNDVWHAAKLRGVAFRAVGQEPGWLLEMIDGEEILLVTDYGQQRRVFPYVDPLEDKDTRETVFQIDATTSLLLQGRPCTDTMSGELFQVTVTVFIDDKTLQGCGRALF